MPYTYKSLVPVWLLIAGLFIVSISGAVGGWWIALLLVFAVAAPSLILRAPAAASTVASGAQAPSGRNLSRGRE